MGDRTDLYRPNDDFGERPSDFTPSEFPPPPSPPKTNEGTPLHEQRAKIAMEKETGLRRTILIFTIFSAGVTVALAVSIMVSEPQLPPHGAVSSPNKMCSEMGAKQMKSGGNAVDAAVTTLLCLGAVFPQYTGIGGGGFMLIHDHRNHGSYLIDFRETAPKGIENILKQPKEEWKRGGLSVGVPGEIRGLLYAQKTYGNKSWEKLFQPVIRMVEAGVPWYRVNDLDLSRRENMGDLDGSIWQKMFTDTFNVRKGQKVIKRPKYAATLKTLAKNPEDFYNGTLAKNIVKAVQYAGGVMTEEDLIGYNYTIRKPLVVTLNHSSYVIETFPAPASGAVLLAELMQIDEVFKQADKVKSKLTEEQYVQQLQKILSDSMKCRAYIGDPKFDKNVETLEEQLVKGDVSNCGDKNSQDYGTSHVSVIDQNEMLVSVTTSMNYWYGSLIMTEDGILLNNQMADFDEQEPNRPEPGKRPASSMVPTIVYHNERPCLKRFAIGGVNGTKIFGGVAQVIANIVTREMSVRNALDHPRLDCSGDECRLFDPDQVYKGSNVVTVDAEANSLVAVAYKSNNTPVAKTDNYEEWGGNQF